MSDPAPNASPVSTPDKILDIAEALFARRGYGSVGMREVARLAGVSKSAVFHHFPSKADLYGGVLARMLAEMAECVRPDVATSAPAAPDRGPLARLVAVVETLVDALAESPTRAPLLLRSLFEEDVFESEKTAQADAILADILGDLRALIDAGVAEGELRDVPSAHVLQTVLGGLVFHFASGVYGDELLGAPVYSAAQIRTHKAFLVSYIEHGLAAGPPTR